MDTRDIYKLVRELSEERDDVINLYDSMDIELNEGFVIETGVVGFMEDGVIVHLDEDAMEFLDFNGVLLESEKQINEDQDSIDAVENAVLRRISNQHTELLSKYGPAAVMAAVRDVAEFAGGDGLDEIGSSDVSIWVRQVVQDLEAGHYANLHEGDGFGHPSIEQFKDKVATSNDPFEMIYDAINGSYGEDVRMAIQEMYDDIVIDFGLHPDDDFESIIDKIIDYCDHDSGDMSMGGHDLERIKKLALGEGWAYSDHWDSKYDDDGEASPREKARAQARRRAEDSGWGTDDERENDAELDEGLGKALLGGAALIAAITGINKMEANHLMKTEPQLVKLAQMRQEAEKRGDEYEVQSLDDRIEKTLDHIRVTGRPVMGPDGKPVVPGEPLGEAEYQGRKVQLNKPMQGDVKKSKVYVKKPNGKVVKVNFGDKDMKIKKSNPERRKSFRARHNCDNPGPKWKARYWSCRAW